MRRLLALLLLALPLMASEPVGAFLGVGGGQDRRFSIDLGLCQSTVQATAWGGHLGFISRLDGASDDPNSTAYTPKAPGSYTATVSFQGYQLGAYMDTGRAFVAAGVEFAAETTRAYVVRPDRTWEVQSDQTKSGAGVYLKAGLKFNAISLYVGYGSKTQLLAGVGLHF